MKANVFLQQFKRIRVKFKQQDLINLKMQL